MNQPVLHQIAATIIIETMDVRSEYNKTFTGDDYSDVAELWDAWKSETIRGREYRVIEFRTITSGPDRAQPAAAEWYAKARDRK